MGSLCFRRGASGRSWRGFTIAEMLTVVAILAILIGLLMPMLGAARERTLQGVCASNLHQIHESMIGDRTDNETLLPTSDAWTGRVIKRGSQKVLICPKDKALPTIDAASVQGYYLVQVDGGKTPTFSYLSDIYDASAGKLSSFDTQLHRIKSGAREGKFGESPNNWPDVSYGASIDPPTWETGFDNDAGVVIESSGGGVRLVSLDAPGDGGKTPASLTSTGLVSDHWVCKGDAPTRGGQDWRKEIVMQLTGKSHSDVVDKPIDVIGAPASYGMNSQSKPLGGRSGQILLLDYEQIVAKVDPTGAFIDDFANPERCFAPRHFNRANVLFVDGSMKAMTRDEADPSVGRNAEMWK